jgi:hypothetical protein
VTITRRIFHVERGGCIRFARTAAELLSSAINSMSEGGSEILERPAREGERVVKILVRSKWDRRRP